MILLLRVSIIRREFPVAACTLAFALTTYINSVILWFRIEHFFCVNQRIIHDDIKAIPLQHVLDF